MAKIRREKVKNAVKRSCDMYTELELTMEEREIVSRSLCVTAKVAILEEQMNNEMEQYMQKEIKTASPKIAGMPPTTLAVIALILAIVSLLVRLLL